MNNRVQKYIGAVALTLLTLASASAQDYMMLAPNNLPQRNLMNPALMPEGSFLAIPFIGSFSVNVENAFSYNKVIDSDKYLNSDKLISGLKKDNLLMNRVNVELIYFGINIGGRNLITFSERIRGHSSIGYPGDAFRLVLDNPLERTNTFDLSGETRTLAWSETAIGYTRQLTHNWTVGGRLKYLAGVGGVFSENTSMKADKSLIDYNLSGNVNIRMGGYDVNADEFEANPFRNPGAALDLGVEYKSQTNIRISAAVTDLGFITWGKNSSRITSHNPDGIYHFKGFNNGSDLLDGNLSTSDLLDSIYQNFFDAMEVDSVSGKSFTTMIPTSFQAGVEYPIDFKQQHKVSLNVLGTIPYQGKFHYGITAGYTFRTLNNRVNLMATVSHKSNDPINFGAGIVINAGSFQFFTMVDDIISPFNLRYARSETVSFGMNFFLNKRKVARARVE